MTGEGRLSIYDGQQLLGFVVERSDRTCVAKDASGHKLGSFPTVQKAVAAVGEAGVSEETGQRK